MQPIRFAGGGLLVTNFSKKNTAWLIRQKIPTCTSSISSFIMLSSLTECISPLQRYLAGDAPSAVRVIVHARIDLILGGGRSENGLNIASLFANFLP
jgi:hypothetical protein